MLIPPSEQQKKVLSPQDGVDLFTAASGMKN